MSARSDNVSRLLDAEKRRNEIVAAAKKARQAKLRQARSDAESEVAAFRAEKEREYDDHKAKHSGGQDSERVALEHEISTQLRDMERTGNANMDKVADEIVKMVCTASL